MKLLVVDNGQRVATRLGQALRELGQEAIISPGPAQAIAAARQLVVDGILVDIDLPSMNGVEFAEALWLFDRGIPVAFRQCTRDRALIDRVAEIGPLFPARWTRADIGRVVADLARMRRPMRGVVRRIKVACRTWEQVETLCDQRDAGKDFLTLRGVHALEPDERLSVTLDLPGALAVSMAAQVASSRPEEGGRVYVIRLVGFTPERSTWLRAMAARECTTGAGAGQEPGEHAPAPLPEWPTRHQVERLAERMRPAAPARRGRSDPLDRGRG